MTNEQLTKELQQAYRCIQGMHHAMKHKSGFAESYHALTLGAAKRYCFLEALDGAAYFLGKPVTELHKALQLGK